MQSNGKTMMLSKLKEKLKKTQNGKVLTELKLANFTFLDSYWNGALEISTMPPVSSIGRRLGQYTIAILVADKKKCLYRFLWLVVMNSIL